jgi:hypothetical protein
MIRASWFDVSTKAFSRAISSGSKPKVASPIFVAIASSRFSSLRSGVVLTILPICSKQARNSLRAGVSLADVLFVAIERGAGDLELSGCGPATVPRECGVDFLNLRVVTDRATTSHDAHYSLLSE